MKLHKCRALPVFVVIFAISATTAIAEAGISQLESKSTERESRLVNLLESKLDGHDIQEIPAKRQQNSAPNGQKAQNQNLNNMGHDSISNPAKEIPQETTELHRHIDEPRDIHDSVDGGDGSVTAKLSATIKETTSKAPKSNADYNRPDEPSEETNTGKLFEGDIDLTEEQRQLIDALSSQEDDPASVQKRKYYKIARKWPNKIIYFHPFYVSARNTWRKAIEAGMRHIEETTCIRFRSRRYGTRISFQRKPGCFSKLGLWKPGRAQPVNIGRGCTRMGTVAHEILHAMGFFHEQSRPDRDNYVIINYRNIRGNAKHNFKKYSWQQTETARVPYDVKSVMHYGPKAFAKDRRRNTITARRSYDHKLMGQRDGLSHYDAKLVNIIYGCKGGNGRTTPRPPRPTRPTGCKDRSRFCYRYRRSGYCRPSHRYYRIVSRLCKVTCGLCGAAPCRDRSRYCSRYRIRGYCRRSSRYFNLMKRFCGRTCRVC